MEKITLNGINYLGELKEGENGIELSNAMEVVSDFQDISESIFGTYLKAENRGSLRSPKVQGMGITSFVENLSPEEDLRLTICRSKMKLAKSGAIEGVENDAFDKLMGK